ncbi:MAG TPA: FAD-dependent oxidoreductase [Alphaproteobacteria bacterium]|nr:FAD-dependent oxidoreductase [Alphaproteobacteria bacterium]
MPGYTYPVYPYHRCADQDASAAPRHKVVIVGAGLVGLTAAIDLGLKGIPVVVIDEDNTVSLGSRSICQAKRTLEIWDRLGCAAPMLAKGITWQKGKVFFRDRMVYEFDLQPDGGHRFPAFINLQQYWVEQYLVERAQTVPSVELRWNNRLAGLTRHDDHVGLEVETPDGRYRCTADWVIAADGARSTARRLMGLEFRGKVFEDRFLIADVYVDTDFPTERWFWFEPPFHPGGSALLHRQADGLWRVDLQLGWTADPEAEKQPERVIPRLKAIFGETAKFEIEWVSIYTFQCRRLERFRHGRVIFAGDSAHQVSPFGARGGNSGVQDADNLCWKLALVVAGGAPESLLDSYELERSAAADEHVMITTRSTDFITPKGAASRLFRNAVLALAETHPFARRLVNSGRLSVPTVNRASPLDTPDLDRFDGGVAPGCAALDAPIATDSRDGWLLPVLNGGFSGLYFTQGPIDPATASALASLNQAALPVHGVVVAPAPIETPAGLCVVVDTAGLAARRYAASPGTFYLLRPDQHVCARWRRFDAAAVAHALRRATAQSEG